MRVLTVRNANPFAVERGAIVFPPNSEGTYRVLPDRLAEIDACVWLEILSDEDPDGYEDRQLGEVRTLSQDEVREIKGEEPKRYDESVRPREVDEAQRETADDEQITTAGPGFEPVATRPGPALAEERTSQDAQGDEPGRDKSVDELMRLSLDDLRREATRAGLDTRGRKRDIALRLVGATRQQQPLNRSGEPTDEDVPEGTPGDYTRSASAGDPGASHETRQADESEPQQAVTDQQPLEAEPESADEAGRS